jgi:peptidoglycan/xylan/chitin deacetylase (PgdA/CDA1 family)
MKVTKEINRKIISPFLIIIKADKIIRNISSSSMLNIMYHGVTRENSNFFSPRHISSQQFERHLQYYSREFDVIGLSQAFTYLQDGYKPNRKTITMSFDDGYLNNLHTALPLLEKYNLKATFFISGICAREMQIRALWTDLLSCIKYFYKDQTIELDNKRFRNFIEVETKILLSDYLSTCGISTLNAHLDYLVSKLKIEERLRSLPEEIWKLLSREELKQLSSHSLVEIGSHGFAHYKMDEIPIADAKNDLQLSRDILQEVTNREINQIAYPFGSYNSLIKDTAEMTGYKNQLAVDYMCEEDLNDLRILNRHGIPSTTTYEANIILLNNAFRLKGYN